MDARNSNVFREIHKNTWLKRLSVDNKKVLVGPKVTDLCCAHARTPACSPYRARARAHILDTL